MDPAADPPLCSVLLPSRKRPEELLQVIQNIASATPSATPYEILVRIDDDDPESAEALTQVPEPVNLRVTVGPRLGYECINRGYYSSLEQEARGHFVWLAGDDMRVNGDWLGELAKVPFSGFVVQPAISTLNASVYYWAVAQAFPIYPRLCWEPFTDAFPSPGDIGIHKIMVEEQGWETWFLKGVTFRHDRASAEELERHREMESVDDLDTPSPPPAFDPPPGTRS